MSCTLGVALAAFFDRYCTAFNQLDGEAIAALYTVPSAIEHGNSYTHWDSMEAICANMRALCRHYRENGYARASYTPAMLLQQGPDHAVVDLCWHIARHGDLAPWQFHTMYNLTRSEAGWQIRLCTAYEEQCAGS